MADDAADPELLELMRQHLGLSNNARHDDVSSNTGVLADAEYIYINAIDVALSMSGTKAAAASIYAAMQQRNYSTHAWSEHDLHPKESEGFSEVEIVNFVFTMDLLNFSFWSPLPESKRYQVHYRNQTWTGYQSLLSCLRRALDDGIPITTPRYWRSRHTTDDALRAVFRSATEEAMPLLDERIGILREAADVLRESFGDSDQDLDDMDDGGQVEMGDDQDKVAERVVVGAEADALADDGNVSLESSVDHEATISDREEAGSQDKGPNEGPSELPTEAPSTTDAEHVPEVIREPTPTEDHHPTTSPEAVANRTPTEPEPVEQVTHDPPPCPPRPDLSVLRLIQKADHSAGRLVNLLAKHFPSFRDETRFDGRQVRFLKRAQILVADLWAAFNGEGYGEFGDIGCLTMFADYRVPQLLHALSVLSYSPSLHYRIADLKEIPSGHSWEVQLRGCSIWAVEVVRREIVARHPEAAEGGNMAVNAVLIDFFLYDLAKERELESGGNGGEGLGGLGLPHHRTRCVWY